MKRIGCFSGGCLGFCLAILLFFLLPFFGFPDALSMPQKYFQAGQIILQKAGIFLGKAFVFTTAFGDGFSTFLYKKLFGKPPERPIWGWMLLGSLSGAGIGFVYGLWSIDRKRLAGWVSLFLFTVFAVLIALWGSSGKLS